VSALMAGRRMLTADVFALTTSVERQVTRSTAPAPREVVAVAADDSAAISILRIGGSSRPASSAGTPRPSSSRAGDCGGGDLYAAANITRPGRCRLPTDGQIQDESPDGATRRPASGGSRDGARIRSGGWPAVTDAKSPTAGRGATRSGPAKIPTPVWISWVALALMTTSSVASLRPAPTMAVYGLASVFLY